jgi:hypothetical protein
MSAAFFLPRSHGAVLARRNAEGRRRFRASIGRQLIVDRSSSAKKFHRVKR